MCRCFDVDGVLLTNGTDTDIDTCRTLPVTTTSGDFQNGVGIDMGILMVCRRYQI